MTELHWIVTLQWPTATGYSAATVDGFLEPDPYATRRELYQSAVEAAREILKVPEGDVAVLFFDLAPNARKEGPRP